MTRQQQLILASVVAGGLLLASCCCGGVGLTGWYISKSQSKPTVVGKWQMDWVVEVTLEFNADGSYRSVSGPYVEEGTWQQLDATHLRIDTGQRGGPEDREFRFRDGALEMKGADGDWLRLKSVK